MADLSSSDLVQRVRDMLGYNPYETTSTTTTTAVTVAVVDGTRWDEGAIGEWQTGTVGYEQFYVQTVAVNNLTVVRGYNGTTAETHTSGDRVLRIDNDGFSGRQIQQAINQSVLDLWPWVWKVGTDTLTYDATKKWYDLNAATLGIVRVMQVKNTSIADIGIFRDRYFGDSLSYLVRRGLPTAFAASTNAIMFPRGVYDTSGTNNIIVTDIRAVVGSTDIVDSSNLPVAEAVTYGAVARLMRASEIRRVTFGSPLEAVQTSGTGARLQLSGFYEDQYRKRLEELSVRLRQLYTPDQVWS